MLATRMATMISETFGIPFKSGRLTEYSTIAEIAGLVGTDTVGSFPSNLVPARTNGSRPPVFMIHGSAGFMFPRPEFLSGFHDDQPVYAFQIRGFDDQQEPHDTVEEIAADYLESMLKINPDRPLFLVSYCGGSWIAVEMVRLLAQQGRKVDRLVMIDPRIERGKMRDKYEAERGLLSGRLFSGDTLIGRGRARVLTFTSKVRTLLATGEWVDFRDKKAFDIQFVKERAIQKRQQGLNYRATTADQFNEEVRESILKICQSDTAAYAAAKLKYALHNYLNDTPIEDPVDIIASRELSQEVANPKHPLNKLLPNHNLIVTGQRHRDTVDPKTPRNAVIIQGLVDETLGLSTETHDHAA